MCYAAVSPNLIKSKFTSSNTPGQFQPFAVILNQDHNRQTEKAPKTKRGENNEY
jgi:hypothetical protein